MHLGGHAQAVVGHAEHAVAAGCHAGQVLALNGGHNGRAGADDDAAAARHGITRVDAQVQQDLRNLVGIGAQEGERPVQGQRQLNVLADEPLHHLGRLLHHRVQVQDAGRENLFAAEGQQLLDERRRALRCAEHLLRVLPHRVAGWQVLFHHLGVAADDHQKVVEVVCDAAGQVADGLHLLRLAELLFQLGAAADIFGVNFQMGAAIRQLRAAPAHPHRDGAAVAPQPGHVGLGALIHAALPDKGLALVRVGENVVGDVGRNQLLGRSVAQHLHQRRIHVVKALQLRIALEDSVGRVINQRTHAPLALLHLLQGNLALGNVLDRALKVQNVAVKIASHTGVLAHKQDGSVAPLPDGFDAARFAVALNLGAEALALRDGTIPSTLQPLAGQVLKRAVAQHAHQRQVGHRDQPVGCGAVDAHRRVGKQIVIASLALAQGALGTLARRDVAEEYDAPVRCALGVKNRIDDGAQPQFAAVAVLHADFTLLAGGGKRRKLLAAAPGQGQRLKVGKRSTLHLRRGAAQHGGHLRIDPQRLFVAVQQPHAFFGKLHQLAATVVAAFQQHVQTGAYFGIHPGIQFPAKGAAGSHSKATARKPRPRGSAGAVPGNHRNRDARRVTSAGHRFSHPR